MSELPGRSGVRAVLPLVLVALLALLVPSCRLPGQEAENAVPPPVTATEVAPERTDFSERQPGVVNITVVRGLESTRAAGTGIVLDASGFVLTNGHVIQGATGIEGTDTDNDRTYPARVIGYDTAQDIAVIRLTGASGLPAARFAPVSTVAIGDPVTAVGNAGGDGGEPSVVTGHVTALGQTVTARDDSDGSVERLAGMIEVSAPIKPGDSGGPLLNSAGRVIGVNTAASTARPESSPGAREQPRGYAIPADRALEIAAQIRRGEPSETVHIGETAMLGVMVRGNGTDAGARVVEVVPGSPAEAAGIPVGAAIVTFGGQGVDSPGTLTGLMLRRHPGEVVRVEWARRGGGIVAADVRLAKGPPQ
ncbi:S1C family serine protease [Actinomadura algeriensis]|uniref:S1-C subfamily serine protease n=1 Tax=Actinomadura algeriensis TaxID=1679523 RepID=A0ABR9K3H9_9ACTN|nr:trypsin-like peptidase domain-containing protein [Actinomadura algeriensis]MBE1537415.1 S1-C subfamily serine protease [Actinomadura algeriensis]